MSEQYRFPNRWLPYALLSVTVVVVVVFFIWPSLESLWLSLFRVSPFGQQTFVGLDNFQRLLADASYRNSFGLTMFFVGFVVLVGLSVSLLGAVVVNQRFRGFGIYRALMIWPYALSPAIAALIWAFMMDPAIGVVSRGIADTTGITLNWRTDGPTALLFICIAATWKMVGYNVVFFLAGLQSVDKNLLDAASVDGASTWTRFWRVTFPLLSPITFFLFVMNSLYAFFDTFGLIHIMTEGGPARSTDLLIFKPVLL